MTCYYNATLPLIQSVLHSYQTKIKKLTKHSTFISSMVYNSVYIEL